MSVGRINHAWADGERIVRRGCRGDQCAVGVDDGDPAGGWQGIARLRPIKDVHVDGGLDSTFSADADQGQSDLPEYRRRSG